MNHYQKLINALNIQYDDPSFGPTGLYLRDYQVNLFDSIESLKENEQLIVLKARQIGATTSLCFYALFYALTHYGSSVLILGTKKDYRKIFLDTIKTFISKGNLMGDSCGQAGLSLHNTSSINFGHSESSLIGGDYDIILVDEFAYHKNGKAITDALMGYSNAKIVIVSTPSNTSTEFYKLWTNATHKLELPYTVLSNRDEQWKKDMILSIGERNFANEFELQFKEPEESKEKQIHIRVTDEEKETIESNAKKDGFNQVSEYLRVLALGNVKKTILNIEACRAFLFLVEPEKTQLTTELTSLIRDVRIDRNEIHLTFLLDEDNIWKKFLKSKEDFKIWWLTRKGDKVDYYQIENNPIDIFPLHFGHDVVEAPSAMAIFKRKA